MRPTHLIVTSLFLVPALVGAASSSARADDTVPQSDSDFELEAQLVGLGTLHTRFGFRVDPHAVILLGPTVRYTAQAAEGDSSSDWSILELSVPLELKVYFVEPSPGVIAPLLRAGIFLGWDRTTFGEETTGITRAGASLGGGVAWFANDTIGVELELGATASRSVDADSNLGGFGARYSETRFRFGGRAGVVLLL